MSKSRPAYAASGQRISWWLDEDITLKETDSGEVVAIAAEFTANRTATLPSAKKGLYFRFIWALNDGADVYYRAIKTASTSELIKGTVFVFSIGVADQSNDIVVNQLNGTSHDEIRINERIYLTSQIELVSDGDHWYTADSQIYTTETTAADAVTEN
jgi:hypothetical protein